MVDAELLKLKPEEIKIYDFSKIEKAFVIPIHQKIVDKKIETHPNKVAEEVNKKFEQIYGRNFLPCRDFLFEDNGLLRAFYNRNGATGIIIENSESYFNANLVSFSKEKALIYDSEANIDAEGFCGFTTPAAYESKNVFGEPNAKFLVEFTCAYLNAVIDELNKKGVLSNF